MSTRLDEVADRLAEQVLDVRRSSNNPMSRWAGRRHDVVGVVAGLVGSVWIAASMFVGGLRMSQDPWHARRLYQNVTGYDRDRADADVNLVTGRLGPLVAAPSGAAGDALVTAAARRLVVWVADGRPDDEGLSDVDEAFNRWADAYEDRADPLVTSDLADAYVVAWSDSLTAT